MSLRDWFRSVRGRGADRRLRRWKESWVSAVEAPDNGRIQGLRESLEAFELPEEEIEVEREMLEGLDRLAGLIHVAAESGLPVVETGHRVVGPDRCHFSAPASMPDEPNQPAGRLLLTSGRAIFVGGSAARTLAWHAIGEALHADRDLVLIRVDRSQLYRFRSNSFGDALCATFLARRLMAVRRGVL